MKKKIGEFLIKVMEAAIDHIDSKLEESPKDDFSVIYQNKTRRFHRIIQNTFSLIGAAVYHGSNKCIVQGSHLKEANGEILFTVNLLIIEGKGL